MPKTKTDRLKELSGQANKKWASNSKKKANFNEGRVSDLQKITQDSDNPINPAYEVICACGQRGISDSAIEWVCEECGV
jgi:hypothetical protein